MYNGNFSVPVCNIFREFMVDGQLCYQADVERFRDEVEKRKIVSEGLVLLLDYNEDRMVEVSGGNQNKQESSSLLAKKKGHEDVVIYVETVGENYKLKSKGITLALTKCFLREGVKNILREGSLNLVVEDRETLILTNGWMV